MILQMMLMIVVNSGNNDEDGDSDDDDKLLWLKISIYHHRCKGKSSKTQPPPTHNIYIEMFGEWESIQTCDKCHMQTLNV